ncbi:hypothetical protein HNR19_004118 [Nocardioides thalensis]|uniref:Uncharacterized protein n=1 Tax=Nocardioides thalensis TaxID=1914755 RepID=A0A853C5R8_9ACTN|nr:hypothetical protein [Nocardioides thalensis]NYJ03420.1 hypothetical protein [Nocardioides thalensis]
MSTVGTLTRLAGTAIGRTAHAVKHPVESAAFAAGLARGTAGAVISGVRRPGPDGGAGAGGATAADGAAGTSERTSRAATTTATPAGTEVGPRPIPDPVATEPSAASRTSAHGGADTAPADDPLAEVGEDPDVETPVGTTGAGEGYNPDTAETGLQQPGTEPLMDPSLTKSVKSEAETLRRAADTEKG